MLTCAILDDYQAVGLTMADWSPLADSVVVRAYRQHFGSEDELVAAISDCEIVVAMRERTAFPAGVIARLPRLQLLITTGMRNSAIDVAAATARGIVVCGTRSAAEPPLELTWALLLGLARNLVSENASFRGGGPWQSSVGADLADRTLGILGLGRIGSRVAAIATAFGMKVQAWSQNLTAERATEVGVQLAASKEELLASSDFVTIHLALSERTSGLIGLPELRLMRSTAFLVNTSRAQIIDEDALIRALSENWIAGAGVDVFESEPLPPDHPLRRLPNLLATPHLGYVTARNYVTYFEDAVENLVAFLAGSPIRRIGPLAPT